MEAMVDFWDGEGVDEELLFIMGKRGRVETPYTVP